MLNKLYERNQKIRTIFVFILGLFLVPLILKIPFVKTCILYMLSFTNNINYKIAYVELLGTLLGSYIAVYGALWVQRKINEKEKINLQKNKLV